MNRLPDTLNSEIGSVPLRDDGFHNESQHNQGDSQVQQCLRFGDAGGEACHVTNSFLNNSGVGSSQTDGNVCGPAQDLPNPFCLTYHYYRHPCHVKLGGFFTRVTGWPPDLMLSRNVVSVKTMQGLLVCFCAKSVPIRPSVRVIDDSAQPAMSRHFPISVKSHRYTAAPWSCSCPGCP